MNIELENGKYTWQFNELTGKQTALRNGDLWRDLCGDNLTLAMAQRIEGQLKLLERSSKYIEELEARIATYK